MLAYFANYVYFCRESICNMLLGILLSSLLSATFTITSSTSVKVEGDVPQRAEAVFASTSSGDKTRLTMGDSAVLTLTGWEGCTIQSVTLSMKSNKSAGVGGLQMLIGEKEVWRITGAPFASVDWNGEYSSTWVDIMHTIGHKVEVGEMIKIAIDASQNSLYIRSYTIHYIPPVAEPYDVHFVSGVGCDPPTLTEAAVHAGVVLPTLADTLQWHFMGWSEVEIQESKQLPRVWQAGERYYPKAACTLWAVYADNSMLAEQVTDYVTGQYVLVDNSPYWGSSALYGAVVQKSPFSEGKVQQVVETVPVTLDTTATETLLLLSDIQKSMVYRVAFLSDSILTIEHINSNTYIGHKGNALAAEAAEWRYRVLEDGSLFIYYEDRGKYYWLMAGYGHGAAFDDIVVCAESFNYNTMLKNNGIYLFPDVEPYYTTWPFGSRSALPEVNDETRQNDTEHVIRIGIYELHVKGGKKNLKVFTI